MGIGENLFVEWLQAKMPKATNALIPNGDDAALLSGSHRGFLVATDMLLDGTHFHADKIEPELIGRKAVAVNLSDIAAMGGTPDSLFISLAVPHSTSPEWLRRVMNGAATLAREFNCGIDGGDTNSWNGPLAINVCVIGTPHWRGAVARSGAQDADVVMVSGMTLGNTLATGHHVNFTPRIREAQWLLDHFEIHALMDLSDGLASDVPRMAKASGKQMILEAARLVVDPHSKEALRSALCDGEDFELLFTCREDTASRIEQTFPWPCGVRRIGLVKKGEGVKLLRPDQSQPSPLTISGYEH
jgi:thiamine-monophosphate kinase